MNDCFVLIPLESGDWATACFESEFTKPKQRLPERDHIWPRHYFPELEHEPWNWHTAHAGCQRQQAAAITNSLLTHEDHVRFGSQGGRTTQARRTPEQRSEVARQLNAFIRPESRRENARKAGIASGIARAVPPRVLLTPAQRSEVNRKAALKRWAATTPEERIEHMKRSAWRTA
jgi:hypothetical protein